MKSGIQIKESEVPISVIVPDRSRAFHFWEMTKPRLTFLVLATTLVGFCMASQGPLDLGLLFHTMMGTALVAAGAAVLNQFMERDVDAKMHRTATRALPSGKLQPGEVMLFGVIMGVLGMVQLLFFVNLLASFLSALTLACYLFVYTPLKKLTPLCTVIGAFPGAIPPMIGWCAVSESLDRGAWILFAILFLWQMPHFYALARMYRDDYERGGFPMLPVVDPVGIRTGIQILSHAFFLVPVSVAPTLFHLTGKIYLWGALMLSLIFLGFAIRASFSKDIPHSRNLFLVSIIYLPLLLILMVVDKI